MSKEVMLLEDVADLGQEGDIVQVSGGYARNYLLPQNLAAPVTNATRRYLEKRRKNREQEDVENLDVAKTLAKKIEGLSVTIPVKTGEDDKLFGSVTSSSILKVVEGQGVVLDKHQVMLDDSINELGVFEVPVKLHPKVTVTLKVWVVKE